MFGRRRFRSPHTMAPTRDRRLFGRVPQSRRADQIVARPPPWLPPRNPAIRQPPGFRRAGRAPGRRRRSAARQTAHPAASSSAPTPAGPPSLCDETARLWAPSCVAVGPACARLPGPHPRAAARRGAGRARPPSATGWITPVSLFASIRHTSAGPPSASTNASASRSATPSGSNRHCDRIMRRRADGVVLDRADDDAPVPRHRVDREGVCLGAAGGEDKPFWTTAELFRQRFPGILEQPPRAPSRPMHRGLGCRSPEAHRSSRLSLPCAGAGRRWHRGNASVLTLIVVFQFRRAVRRPRVASQATAAAGHTACHLIGSSTGGQLISTIPAATDTGSRRDTVGPRSEHTSTARHKFAELLCHVLPVEPPPQFAAANDARAQSVAAKIWSALCGVVTVKQGPISKGLTVDRTRWNANRCSFASRFLPTLRADTACSLMRQALSHLRGFRDRGPIPRPLDLITRFELGLGQPSRDVRRRVISEE